MQLVPNSAALQDATALQALLVDCKVRLFKSGFTPSVATTRAEMVAQEADFTGYPVAGVEVTAVLAPVSGVPSGYSITVPTVQFAAGTPYTVGNVIGGFWLETAAGIPRAIGTFPSGIPVGAAGQGFPLTITLGYPAG